MWIKKLYMFALDFLFEKDEMVRELEKMDAKELRTRAERSSSACALFSYKEPLIKALVWNMKFRRNKKCFELAGEALSEELCRFDIEKPLIIPVPISAKRRRERGYNQTELLAEEIMKHDKQGLWETSASCIKRTHTLPQTSLSKKERRENLKGTFVVTMPDMVRGRNIVVLDDVITTGATMEEITKVLIQAGAKRIIHLAFAHAS